MEKNSTFFMSLFLTVDTAGGLPGSLSPFSPTDGSGLCSGATLSSPDRRPYPREKARSHGGTWQPGPAEDPAGITSGCGWQGRAEERSAVVINVFGLCPQFLEQSS